MQGGEGAAPRLLRRVEPAVPCVSAGAFEPAVRAHRAAERLGRDLARRRGHDDAVGGVGGEEEEGDGASGGVEDDEDAAATVGSVPRPPLRRGVIR